MAQVVLGVASSTPCSLSLCSGTRPSATRHPCPLSLFFPWLLGPACQPPIPPFLVMLEIPCLPSSLSSLHRVMEAIKRAPSSPAVTLGELRRACILFYRGCSPIYPSDEPLSLLFSLCSHVCLLSLSIRPLWSSFIAEVMPRSLAVLHHNRRFPFP